MKTTHHELRAFAQYPKHFIAEFAEYLWPEEDDKLRLVVEPRGEDVNYEVQRNGQRICSGFLTEHQTLKYTLQIKLAPAFETIVVNHGLVSLLP